MMKEALLRAGFYFDGLELTPLATNREILNYILDLREQIPASAVEEGSGQQGDGSGAGRDIQEMLLEAQRYLTAERVTYEFDLLPCLDYIRILLRNRYGKEIEKMAIDNCLLELKQVEDKFKAPPAETALARLLGLEITKLPNTNHDIDLLALSDSLLKEITDSARKALDARDYINNVISQIKGQRYTTVTDRNRYFWLPPDTIKLIYDKGTMGVSVFGLIRFLEKILAECVISNRQTLEELVKKGKSFVNNLSRIELKAMDLTHPALKNVSQIIEKTPELSSVSVYSWERRAKEQISQIKKEINLAPVKESSLATLSRSISMIEEAVKQNETIFSRNPACRKYGTKASYASIRQEKVSLSFRITESSQNMSRLALVDKDIKNSPVSKQTEQELQASKKKNLSVNKKLTTLENILGFLKQKKFLSGFWGTISGNKQKVHELKREVIDLLQEYPFPGYAWKPLEKKWAELREQETLSEIYTCLKAFHNFLNTEDITITKTIEHKKQAAAAVEEALVLLKEYSPEKAAIPRELSAIAIQLNSAGILLNTEIRELDEYISSRKKNDTLLVLAAETNRIINGAPVADRIKNKDLSAMVYKKNTNQLICADLYGNIWIWEINMPRIVLKNRVKAHNGCVTALACAAGKPILVSGDKDGSLVLWNSITWEKLKTVKAHTGKVLSLTITGNGEYLISGGEDGSLLFWGLPQLEIEGKLTGHNGMITSIAVDNDLGILVGGETNNQPNQSSIYLWDIKERKLIKKIRNHGGPVTCLAMGNEMLATVESIKEGGSRDKGRIFLYDTLSSRLIDVLEGHTGPIEQMLFLNKGEWLLSAGSDSSLWLWDVHAGKGTRIEGYDARTKSLAVDAAGKWLFQAGASGISVWHLSPIIDKMIESEGSFNNEDPVHPNRSIIFPAVVTVSQSGGGDFTLINDAMKAARPGTRILVKPGIYQENILINKNVELIGEGKTEDIIIESATSPLISVNTEYALISGLTLHRKSNAASNASYAVDVSHGQLILEDCVILSADLAGVAIHNTTATAIIKRCVINDGNQSGIYLYNSGKAVIEDCDVFNNKLQGVEVKSARCAMHRCRIYDCQGAGVNIYDHSTGIAEDCEIWGNQFSGLQILNGGNTTFLRCTINNGKSAGILALKSAHGVLENCTISGNSNSGLCVGEGANMVLRKCRVNNNGYNAIWIYDKAEAVVEDCDLSKNQLDAWKIGEGCTVKKQGNKE
jgi:parallel beta-helix repeat protein